MFADPTELIFLEDCCKFTLDPYKQVLDIFRSKQYVFLSSTFQQYVQGKKNLVISNDPNLLEQCILERLRQPTTNPHTYLVISLKNFDELKEKPWNQTEQIAKLCDTMKTLVSNYLMTIIQYPDEFTVSRLVSDREKDQKQDNYKMIARLFDIFDEIGFDQEMLKQFINGLSEQYSKVDLHKCIILYAQYCVRQLHIFLDKLELYLSLFEYYFASIEYRELIFNDQIGNWNVKTDKGSELERDHILGPFLTISLLQKNDYVVNRAHQELSGKMTKRKFEQLISNYSQISSSYTGRLLDLIKKCLVKSTFQQTINFFQNACNSNRHKLKEGYQLNKQKRVEFNVSTDGFVVNLYDVLLQLSNKISSRQDETYKLIDEKFWLNVPFPNEQMLLSQNDKQQQTQSMIFTQNSALIKGNYQIGNVSYLFFYALKFLQVGLVPTIQQLKNTLKQLEEMKSQEQFFKGTIREKLFKDELDKLDAETHQYEIVLFNSNRIRDTIQLQDTFVFYLLKWINVEKMIDGQAQWKKPDILYYLPEGFVSDLIEINEFYLSHYENYTQQFLKQDKFIAITQLAVYFMHLPLATNKYLAGKLIEVIFLYTKVAKKNLNFYGIFQQNQIIRDNILLGLMDQYAAVGETGANNQFYAKFSYRFYINDLLCQFLAYPFFQDMMRKYQKSASCHRLIKLMCSDMNHCFEEIWVTHLDNFRKCEAEPGNNPEERMKQQRQIEHIKSQCKANLQNTKSNLKLLVELSNHIPETLMDDIFREQIIQMMNYYLFNLLSEDDKFVERVKTLRRIADKDFKLSQILQQLGNFYANISHINKVTKTVVNDSRSYNFKFFGQLAQTFRQNSAGQQDKVEKLESFIQNLQLKEEKQKLLASILQEIVIPEKYQDPIMGDLIRDPVRLPKSGQIMDRKVIIQQLLEKKIDPFTSTPLTEEQLIPQSDLKKEIDLWYGEIKKKRDEKIKEVMKNKITQEFQPIKTQSLKLQDDDEDDDVFKGKQYQDDE